MKMLVLSANKIGKIVLETHDKSFMYNINKRGSRTEP